MSDITKINLPSVASISCMRCKEAYPINSIEHMCFTDGNCQTCRAELSGKFCTGQGRKDDSSKRRYSLLPKGAVNSVVDVLEFGSKKYADNNWQKVPDAKTRYYDAAMRHLDAWLNGDLKDAETGLPHLAHAICCLMFLMWFDSEAADD